MALERLLVGGLTAGAVTLGTEIVTGVWGTEITPGVSGTETVTGVWGTEITTGGVEGASAGRVGSVGGDGWTPTGGDVGGVGVGLGGSDPDWTGLGAGS
jgi:hypothetical protein